MGAELQVKGMDGLLERLEEMGKVGKRTKKKILTLAAQPILEEMVATGVFKDRTGDGRKGLLISRPKAKGDTEFVLIGIDEKDISEIYYMKFIEFGTSKMPARPFARPAYYKRRAEAYQIMKKELRKELGL